MLGIIALVVSAIILALVFFNPKNGPVFLWALLFMYPHFYMWQRQFLPLNIGIDDLYIIVFFLAVVLRRNMIGGVGFRFGTVFWIIFLYFIVLVMTNVNSYVTVRGEEGARFIKSALKAITIVLLVYSLINTIDNVEDVKRSMFAFCFFSGCGAVLVILSNYFPHPMKAFTSPQIVLKMWQGVDMRPSGAFMNSNNAALIMGCSCLIITTTLKLKSRYFNKVLRVGILGLLIVAILMTLSRAGILGLAVPLSMMCLLGKQKRFGIIFLIVVLAAVILLPQVRGMLFARFEEGGTSGLGFWRSLEQRYTSGMELWRGVTFSRFLFGVSHQADYLLGNNYPHSFYQGLTLSYGLSGTIWTVWLVVFLYRKSKAMKNSANYQISAFGSAIRWCLVDFAVFGLAAGIFDNPYGVYTLFLLTVVAGCGYSFINDYEVLNDSEVYISDYQLQTEGQFVDNNDISCNDTFQ
jgi:hypothetical protein